ncbi:MAG: hypothetical protein JW966_00665 [Anaerolineae bacterium]|nr:hypothetical protein [Anaerolineae bacterium]
MDYLYQLTLEKPDTIVLRVNGELIEQAVIDIDDKLRALTCQPGVRRMLLMDLTFAVPMAQPACMRLVGLLQNRRICNVAFFGASDEVEMLVKVMLRATHREQSATFFDGEPSARRWLALQTRPVVVRRD